MILAGQLCSAVQMVVEETFLKKRNLEAALVGDARGASCLLVLPTLMESLLPCTLRSVARRSISLC